MVHLSKEGPVTYRAPGALWTCIASAGFLFCFHACSGPRSTCAELAINRVKIKDFLIKYFFNSAVITVLRYGEVPRKKPCGGAVKSLNTALMHWVASLGGLWWWRVTAVKAEVLRRDGGKLVACLSQKNREQCMFHIRSTDTK